MSLTAVVTLMAPLPLSFDDLAAMVHAATVYDLDHANSTVEVVHDSTTNTNSLSIDGILLVALPATSLRTRISTLEQKVEAMSADQGHLDTDVAALQGAATSIQAEIDALKAQPAAASLDFTALDSAAANLTSIGAENPPPAPTPAPTPAPAPVDPNAPPPAPADPNAPVDPNAPAPTV